MWHCKCEIEYGTSSLLSNTRVTPDLFKNFLITSLTTNDPCTPTNFSDMVDQIWRLMSGVSGCDLELQYLLTRQQLLVIMMGCRVYDIYRSDSISESNSRSELTTKQDSESQSQQTGHSSGYNDLIGTQRYNDFANSVLRAESQRSAYSESHDESHQRMDDVGHGEAVSETVGDRGSESARFSQDYSESTATSVRDGARRGYNYNHSASRTQGFGVNLAAYGYARTPTKNTWDQLMRSDTADSGFSERRGTSSRGLRAEATSFSTTERQSSSFFNAMMDERIWGASVAKAEDHQRSQSDNTSHAEGLGQSSTEQEGKSQGSNQGTSQSQSLSITERDGSRSSYTISDTINAQQRFQALRDLYDATGRLIDYRRKILATRQGYGIAPITVCLRCGYTPDFMGDPARSRLCLCLEPYCPDCSPVRENIVVVHQTDDRLCLEVE